jgi:outer membrane receptor protein involved in Fe transport
VQDEIKVGNLVFTPGFRLDRYDGLASKTEPEPCLGIAYNVKRTGTMLRAAYARTLETPTSKIGRCVSGVAGRLVNIRTKPPARRTLRVSIG